MRKRWIALLLGVVLSGLLSPGIRAGDLPEAIRDMENIDILLCRVTSADENEFGVVVEHSVRKKIDAGSDLRFAQLSLHYGVSADNQLIRKAPDVDDFVVLTVDAGASPVCIEEPPLLCAFADGTDPETVKLLTAGGHMLERFNDYLNAGWYDNEILPAKANDAQTNAPAATAAAPSPAPSATEQEHRAVGLLPPWMPFLAIAGGCVTLLLFLLRRKRR